jgi:hypothetical protein
MKTLFWHIYPFFGNGSTFAGVDTLPFFRMEALLLAKIHFCRHWETFWQESTFVGLETILFRYTFVTMEAILST